MQRTSILFGLVVALLWGTNDTLATFTSRKIGSVMTTLLSLIASVIVLLLFGLLSGQMQGIATFSQTELLVSLFLGMASGLCASIGYFSLYRGLELGPLAIVSPLVAADGAVAAVLAVLFLHEIVDGWQAVLLFCILCGICCASTNSQEIGSLFQRSRARVVRAGGVRWGVMAMLAFGVMLFTIGATSKHWGWFLPIFWTRLFAMLFLVIGVGWQHARAKRRLPSSAAEHQIPSRLTFGATVLAAMVGILESAGLLTYSLGTQLTGTSIVAAISSCFGLIPLFVGIGVLHERPTWIQVVGVCLVMGGLLLLSVKPS